MIAHMEFMTNLLFHLVVSLVTNTTETFTYPQIPGPCPDAEAFSKQYGGGVLISCAVMHWQDDKRAGPNGKTTKTTVHRVTNAVEIARDGVFVAPTDAVLPRVLELGRCEIKGETQSFMMALQTNWLSVPNGPPHSWFVGTNSALRIATNITIEWLGPPTAVTNRPPK
jgi:hypothetical protein